MGIGDAEVGENEGKTASALALSISTGERTGNLAGKGHKGTRAFHVGPSGKARDLHDETWETWLPPDWSEGVHDAKIAGFAVGVCLALLSKTPAFCNARHLP